MTENKPIMVVAKSAKGHEFLYSARSAHKVSKASANAICKALNEAGYHLNDGEVWHVHQVDKYDNAWVYAHAQEFRVRKGVIQRWA